MDKASRRALKRWKEQGYRYLPPQYELKDLICSIKEKKAVPLPRAVRKVRLSFRRGLSGNSFRCGAWAYLTGQWLSQKGCLSKLPTASGAAGPAVVPLQLAKPSGYSCSFGWAGNGHLVPQGHVGGRTTSK